MVKKAKTTKRSPARSTDSKAIVAAKPFKAKKAAKTPATMRGRSTKTAVACSAKGSKKPTAKATTQPTARQQRNQAVDRCIATLGGWRRECVTKLRQLIHESASRASKSHKRGQRDSEHQGPLAWIKDRAKHADLGFWRGLG